MTMETALAWYAYAVVPVGAPVPQGHAILPGARIEAIDAAGIIVLASLVSRDLFDSADSANRTADPAWMAERVEAHHKVNSTAAVAGACLPLTFGVLFSSLDVLRAWAMPRAAQLQAALGRVTGRSEWTVTLQEDAPVHAAWLERSDAGLRELTSAVASAGAGTAFLLARRLDKARAAARLAHLQAAGDAVAADLAQLADVTPEASRSGMPTWSVLAPQAGPAALHQHLGPHAAALAETGLMLQVSGPWPAYSYARNALAEDPSHG